MLNVAGLSSEQDNGSSSYVAYPADKPFINTAWKKSNKTISKAYPESNRDLIIGTLKNMQKKLNKLELEEKLSNKHESRKSNIEKNQEKLLNDSNNNNLYQALPINPNDDMECFIDGYNTNNNNNNNSDNNNNASTKLTKNSDLLNSKSSSSQSTNLKMNTSTLVTTHLNNIEIIDEKSVSTEKRVLELEKQLEKMRKLLNEETVKDRNNNNNNYVIDYNQDTENEFMRDDKNNRQSRKNKSKKKSKRFRKSECFDQENNTDVYNRSRSAENMNRSKSGSGFTQNHYRLNLGDIPFVVGKSTAPSHHLGTNIQNVISLLKMHHPKLCNSTHHNGENCQLATQLNSSNMKCSNTLNETNTKNERSKTRQTRTSKPSSNFNRSASAHHKLENNKSSNSYNSSFDTPNDSKLSDDNYSSTTSSIDFNELLRILQDEYTKYVLQHYDLTKKMIHCLDLNMRNDYETQAESIHKKMKIKARQINKLKTYQHQQQVIKQNKTELTNDFDEIKLNRTFMNKKTNAKSSESCFNTSHSNDHLSRSPNHQPNSRQTLKLFKDIKNLQHKIQNDELIF